MRNVVVICLDSVRKDKFDDVAHHLRSLSDVSFEQCRAASSWSLPSHGSMLTGELPSVHGAHRHHFSYSHIPVSARFLDELTRHTTIGVSANTYASPEFDFDRGFDRFHTISTYRRRPFGLNPHDVDGTGKSKYARFLLESIKHEHPVDSILNGVFRTIQKFSEKAPIPKLLDDGAKAISHTVLQEIERADEPYFVFTNYMDAHLPFRPTRGYDSALYNAPATWSSADYDKWAMIYDPDEDYLRHLRDLYSASIDYLDRQLSAFLRKIIEISDRETTIIITADHGDNLGYDHEDGLLRHRGSLSEGLLQVPLYLINPPIGYAANEYEYFSHLELGTLVTGLASGETPEVFADEIVSEVVGLGSPTDEAPPRDPKYWDRMIRCHYTSDEKTEWDSLGKSRRFKLDEERPCWQREVGTGVNVSDIESEWFSERIVDAKCRLRRTESENEIDDETKGRLKQLGYL